MIKVLIVEDDPMVAQLNKRYVQSVEGFKVVDISTNGEDALRIMKSMEIDLLILDIYMPKLNGITMLEEMRKSLIKTDVIMVTAAKEAGEIDKALKLGAVDYLIKPFDGNRIKTSLNNYLIRYNLLHDKEDFQQEDVDRITYSMKRSEENNIEKGLHKNTLRIIKAFIEKNNDRFLTTEEISEQTGLSKVTIRRYMEHLVGEGEVIAEIEYGSIGRPCYLYKCILN